MPTPKLFVRQYKSPDGKVYMFHRYWDNHNNNYEYQVYELVVAKKVARKLGAPDIPEGLDAQQNSRRMCDWVWENLKQIED
jgi:hypothetical protein